MLFKNNFSSLDFFFFFFFSSELLRETKKSTIIKSNENNEYDEDERGEMGVQETLAFIATIGGAVMGIVGMLGVVFLVIAFICVGVAFYRTYRAQDGVRVALKAALKTVFCLAVSKQTGTGGLDQALSGGGGG